MSTEVEDIKEQMDKMEITTHFGYVHPDSEKDTNKPTVLKTIKKRLTNNKKNKIEVLENDILEKLKNENKKSEYVKVPILRGTTEIEPLLDILKVYGGFIAGGYASYCTSTRRTDSLTPPSDIDVFCKSIDSFDNIVSELSNSEAYGTYKSHETPNTTSFNFSHYTNNNPLKYSFAHLPTIQIVKPFIYNSDIASHGPVEHVLNNFDFSVCRAAIIDNKTALVDKRFLSDDTEKIIRICNFTKPMALLSRIIKYTSRGYTILPSEMMKIFVYWDTFDANKKHESLKLFSDFMEEYDKFIYAKKEEGEPVAPVMQRGGPIGTWQRWTNPVNMIKTSLEEKFKEKNEQFNNKIRQLMGYRYDVFTQNKLLSQIESLNRSYSKNIGNTPDSDIKF